MAMKIISELSVVDTPPNPLDYLSNLVLRPGGPLFIGR